MAARVTAREATMKEENQIMDLSIFMMPETWVTLVTLLFLELALGVDNLVFITITSDRLPPEKQHLGRRLGLAGALIMRVIFLCFASALVHMTTALFTINLGFWSHGVSVRDLVLLAGGLYLVYKGASELLEMRRLATGEETIEERNAHRISLPQAVGTIMAMDLVFSIDSVITAVGLADQLIIMIIAVMVAILLMMAFVDQVSNFVNSNAGIKVLALVFMAVVGCLLTVESLGFHTGVEVIGIALEKFVIYVVLALALIVELVRIKLKAGAKQRAAREYAPGGAAVEPVRVRK